MNLPKCLDCGKQLRRHHNKRCRSCFGKFISKRICGESHYKYKDGGMKPCIECGKVIKAPYPRRCMDCYKIYQKLNPPGKGRIISEETRERLRVSHRGQVAWNKGLEGFMVGEDNPSWKGGINKDKNHRNKLRNAWRQIKRANGLKYDLHTLLPIEIIQNVYEDNIKKFGSLTCIYCLKKISFGKDSIEHLLPLSRGGNNNYDNLAIACRPCNSSKGNKTISEWLQWKIKKEEVTYRLAIR